MQESVSFTLSRNKLLGWPIDAQAVRARLAALKQPFAEACPARLAPRRLH